MLRRLISHFIFNLVSKSLRPVSITLAVSFLSFMSAGHAQVGADALSSASLQEQDAQGVPTLKIGNLIEREIAGGQQYDYQITLNEGQYASLIVEQGGIDVLVRVLGVDTKPVSEFDLELRNHGTEAVDMSGRLQSGKKRSERNILMPPARSIIWRLSTTSEASLRRLRTCIGGRWEYGSKHLDRSIHLSLPRSKT